MARASAAGHEKKENRVDGGCIGGAGMRDQKGGMRGAKDFMAVISLLLDSIVFHCPFSLFVY